MPVITHEQDAQDEEEEAHEPVMHTGSQDPHSLAFTIVADK